MVASTCQYRLIPSQRGGLQIWEHPVPGKQYVLASDTAGGGPGGDFSVVMSIDAETCALVAMWRERMGPIPWGRMAARLATYYSGGVLAFETGPSSHGLAACHAAIGYGYHNIYRRTRDNVASQDETELIGWATTSTTKPGMIARVQEALEQNLPIPSRELLMELKEQRYDKDGKVYPERNDDMMVTYAIALCVRDRAWTRGLLRTTQPVAKDDASRFWKGQEQKLAALQRPLRRRMNAGL